MSAAVSANLGTHAQRQRVQVASKAEEVVALRLRSIGFVCVAKIETGWHIIRKPVKDARGGMVSRIVGASPIRNVAGDLRAMVPGSGRSVLCEVKKRAESLSWSHFEDHQRYRLTEHANAGGISLIAWVSPWGAAVMRWPVSGFGHGEPLHWAGAQMRALNTLPERA